MKFLHNGKSPAILVLMLNLLFFALILILFGIYKQDYQQKLQTENINNIANINQAAANIASFFFSSNQTKLADIVRYSEAQNFTYEEVLAYIYSFNSDPEGSFQLIQTDYTGHLASKEERESFIAVDYRNSTYSELQEIFSAAGAGEKTSQTGFTPEFTDSYSGVKCFALYTYIALSNGDNQPAYNTLMFVSKSKDTIHNFSLDGGYNSIATALIDSTGAYILGDQAFKSTNFFQYLYVYNDLSLDQQNQIAQEVHSQHNGELYYQDSQGRDCLFHYALIANSDWYCITCVPLTSFRSSDFALSYTLFTILILLALLLLDVFWLRSMNRRLRTSMALEKEANNAKTDFLSRMSHDIRTPLNGVIGMTKLALAEPSDPVIKEYLGNIEASGNFLLGLVNDILDMSKVESGKMELHPEAYSYAEFRQAIEAIIKPLGQDKQIEFIMRHEGENRTLLLDRLRFNQIFFNLLSNAFKFTPPGGKVELLSRELSLEDQQIALEFKVCDNGIGMSEEFQAHMYDPFAQENNSSTTKSTGTGLGLSIVHNLVQIMGGSIQVQSQLGQGSTFIITLTSQVLKASAPSQPAKIIAPQQFQNKRILVCEDNAINATIAKKFLEKVGAVVEVAVNGQEGVNRFAESQPGYYAAICMDVMMPIMDGLTATRTIRAMERPDAQSIPILAMTANAYDSDIRNCLEAGMNAHLAKPIEPERMYAALAKYIYPPS